MVWDAGDIAVNKTGPSIYGAYSLIVEEKSGGKKSVNE